MGNTFGYTSSHSDQNDQKSNKYDDYKYLGNHYPLGDDEIYYLYQIYQAMLSYTFHDNDNNNSSNNDDNTKNTATTKNKKRSSSYLYYLSKHCLIITYDQQMQKQSNLNENNWANQEEIDIANKENRRRMLFSYLYLIQIIENQILPCQCFERLYQNNFLPPSNHEHHDPHNKMAKTSHDDEISTITAADHHHEADATMIDEAEGYQDDVDIPNNIVIMDEYTKRTYLDAFFRGITMTTQRRGARFAIEAMFYSCPPVVNEDNSSDNNNNPSSRRIKAKDLIHVGYRLALAAAYLNDNEGTNDDDTAATKKDDTNGEEGERTIPRTELISTVSSTSSLSSYNNNNNGRERYIPDNADTNNDTILAALTHSLLSRAKSRYKRNFGIAVADDNDPALFDIATNGYVDLEDVYDWLDNVVPLFGSIIASFMDTILSPKQYVKNMIMKHHHHTSSINQEKADTDGNNPDDNSASSTVNNVRTNYILPSVPKGSSNFFQNDTSPLLFIFGCLSSSLTPSDGTSYYRLYSSTNDGLSFNRLLHSVLGYAGPTLFIIRAASSIPSIFGAYTNTAWKESKDFYGNTDCFLYQLLPHTSVYRPKGSATNFMYCNSIARSRGYDQQCHGIGFGGTIQQPRLFLDESFENNIASHRDLTFDNGYLLPQPPTSQENNLYNLMNHSSNNNNSIFDIDCIEVWGVGSKDVISQGLLQRDKQRDITNEAIRRARKVDKAQFLDDLRNGTMGDNKNFKHRAELDGTRIDVEKDLKR